jgi:hypothetical protein
MDLFETEWDIAFRTGKENEQERIIKIIESYGSKDMTEELVALIRGQQPHPPQQFRDRSNGE